jgi:hypothetical protein
MGMERTTLARNFASFLGDWLPHLSELRERSAFAAVLLCFALVGAPLTSAIQGRCGQCPATCPMHQAAEAGQHKPSCHAAGRSTSRHDDARGVGFTRPPCSHHGAVPGVALSPMILPAAVRSQFVPPIRGVGAPAPLARVRNSDPPDTPPPILSI